jgi:hypothetical protein
VLDFSPDDVPLDALPPVVFSDSIAFLRAADG